MRTCMHACVCPCPSKTTGRLHNHTSGGQPHSGHFTMEARRHAQAGRWCPHKAIHWCVCVRMDPTKFFAESVCQLSFGGES
jgi:hypothetical protein